LPSDVFEFLVQNVNPSKQHSIKKETVFRINKPGVDFKMDYFNVEKLKTAGFFANTFMLSYNSTLILSRGGDLHAVFAFFNKTKLIQPG
jgi:hypothetical protein